MGNTLKFTVAAAAIALSASVAFSAELNSGIFGSIADVSPRSVFDQLQQSAPRSPFDQIQDSTPVSPFDQLKDSAPNAENPFQGIGENAP